MQHFIASVATHESSGTIKQYNTTFPMMVDQSPIFDHDDVRKQL